MTVSGGLVPPLVLGKDHRIEKISDEVGKVVGVVVGEENVGDPMAIHASF